MLVRTSKLSAYAVYLIHSGITSLSFSLIFTVNLVYQVETARLNPLQLVLVGTALECVAFVCQVPTGVLADIYSRHSAVMLGILLFGLAFVIEGSFPCWYLERFFLQCLCFMRMLPVRSGNVNPSVMVACKVLTCLLYS